MIQMYGGKPYIVNGKLNFSSSITSSRTTTSTSGTSETYYSYSRISDNMFKVDYIIKHSNTNNGMALRINGADYAMCMTYYTPDKKGNDEKKPIKFFGSIKLSSLTMHPLVMEIEDASQSKNGAQEAKKEGQGTAEESKKNEPKQYPIALQQDGAGQIRLLVQVDQTTLHEYRTDNFWDLFMIVPANVRKDLCTLCRHYNASFFSAEQNVLFLLNSAISKIPKIDEQKEAQYKQWVADLSSDDFVTRLAATDRIKNEGKVFDAYIRKVDLSQLDSEARIRLKLAINNSFFDVIQMDDDEGIANQFMGKDYLYITFLESDNPAFRELAVEKLKEKLGDQFHYDFSAPEETRKAQMEELKKLAGFPQANIIKMDEDVQKRFKTFIESMMDRNVVEYKF